MSNNDGQADTSPPLLDKAVLIGGTVASNTSAGGLVTTLPSTPTDQEQAVLSDSTSAPTYAWLLQWSATASKWLFLGGSYAFSQIATAETINSTSYGALATAGPSISLTRAGSYTVEIGFSCNSSNPAGGNLQFMSFDIGGTGAVDANAAVGGSIAAANSFASVSRAQVLSGIATSTTLTAKYKNNPNNSATTFSNRWMRVVPIALS